MGPYASLVAPLGFGETTLTADQFSAIINGACLAGTT